MHWSARKGTACQNKQVHTLLTVVAYAGKIVDLYKITWVKAPLCFKAWYRLSSWIFSSCFKVLLTLQCCPGLRRTHRGGAQRGDSRGRGWLLIWGQAVCLQSWEWREKKQKDKEMWCHSFSLRSDLQPGNFFAWYTCLRVECWFLLLASLYFRMPVNSKPVVLVKSKCRRNTHFIRYIFFCTTGGKSLEMRGDSLHN